MIVNHNQRRCHQMTGIMQNLTWLSNRTANPTNKDRLLLNNTVLRIQIDSHQMLLRLVPNIQHHATSHLLTGHNLLRTRQLSLLNPLSQLHHSLQFNGFHTPNTRNFLKLIQGQTRQIRQTRHPFQNTIGHR